MRSLFVAVFVVLLAGCSREAPPTLAGGKPVSHWVEALQSSPDAMLRKEAAFKLGNVGPTDPTALPALVVALKDRDPAVRCEAVTALMKFGTAAQEAVPALTNLRDQDRDSKVRTYATKALEKLQNNK
jgi:HEAT repeat protein